MCSELVVFEIEYSCDSMPAVKSVCVQGDKCSETVQHFHHPDFTNLALIRNNKVKSFNPKNYLKNEQNEFQEVYCRPVVVLFG